MVSNFRARTVHVYDGILSVAVVWEFVQGIVIETWHIDQSSVTWRYETVFIIELGLDSHILGLSDVN